MAKLEMDPPYRHVRGRIGGLVYRRNGDGTAIAKARTDGPSRPPSEAQRAVHEQFRAAVAYVRVVQADPALAPRYAAAAAASGMQLVPFVVRDFFAPPQVDAIDATAYHGAIGNVIKVRARDHFEVVGVTLIIRGANNAVREQGAALLGLDGLWHYTATTAIPAGTALTLEAVAIDRPGHPGSRMEELLVA